MEDAVARGGVDFGSTRTAAEPSLIGESEVDLSRELLTEGEGLSVHDMFLKGE